MHEDISSKTHARTFLPSCQVLLALHHTNPKEETAELHGNLASFHYYVDIENTDNTTLLTYYM